MPPEYRPEPLPPNHQKARQHAGLFRFQSQTPTNQPNPNPTTTMAIKLISNYSKRLGLPGFSSHQFSVSVETELLTTDDIPGECLRLYRLLQSNVDEQIQVTGFVPPFDYGMDPATPAVPPNGTNGHAHANGNPPPNGTNGHARHAAPPVQSANTPNLVFPRHFLRHSLILWALVRLWILLLLHGFDW